MAERAYGTPSIATEQCLTPSAQNPDWLGDLVVPGKVQRNQSQVLLRGMWGQEEKPWHQGEFSRSRRKGFPCQWSTTGSGAQQGVMVRPVEMARAQLDAGCRGLAGPRSPGPFPPGYSEMRWDWEPSCPSLAWVVMLFLVPVSVPTHGDSYPGELSTDLRHIPAARSQQKG